MWRFIVMIACALLVGDATGFIDDCDETCQDDTSGNGGNGGNGGKDRCPPACSDCACPGHAMRVSAPRTEIATTVAFVERAEIELPPPVIERGLSAPAPELRPPIASS